MILYDFSGFYTIFDDFIDLRIPGWLSGLAAGWLAGWQPWPALAALGRPWQLLRPIVGALRRMIVGSWRFAS